MRNPSIRYEGRVEDLPTITVVTPCLNHADYLEACMRSVLAQGYPKLEYIVIDGGSTDGSTAIIEQFADHLAHWQSEPDGGIYDAINQGFARSTGELMAWIGADDMLHRNSLWTAAAIFSQFPDVDWITGQPTNFDDAGRVFVNDVTPAWSRVRYLRGDYAWIQQESVMWRRRLWDRAGGALDTQYRIAADMDLWMRFFRYANLHTTTALLAGFRQTREQRSKRQAELYREEAAHIIASEPRTDADRAALRRLERFDRWWLRLPIVRKSWRVRQGYRRCFAYPPIIRFDHPTNTFKLLEPV